MRRPRPAQFVDGAPREDECGPRLRHELKALARGEHLVPDGATQNDVQEILHVLMVWNHARGRVMILEREAAPWDPRAAQRRPRMQERLDATLADDFDSGNDRPINGCPWRH